MFIFIIVQRSLSEFINVWRFASITTVGCDVKTKSCELNFEIAPIINSDGENETISIFLSKTEEDLCYLMWGKFE